MRDFGERGNSPLAGWCLSSGSGITGSGVGAGGQEWGDASILPSLDCECCRTRVAGYGDRTTRRPDLHEGPRRRLLGTGVSPKSTRGKPASPSSTATEHYRKRWGEWCWCPCRSIGVDYVSARSIHVRTKHPVKPLITFAKVSKCSQIS